MNLRIFVIVVFLAASVLAASAQQKEINIFLQQDIDMPDNTVSTELVVVKRPASPGLPLRSSLEWLFDPKLSAEEERQQIREVDYGMKFEGVTLKKGIATVRFSETAKANYGTASGGIFYEAIRKTAGQFRSVRKVVICVVGETGLDAEYEKPLFKPCK